MNKENLRHRFLSDSLPVRLGGLSATLGRISSSARTSSSHDVVADLLDEAKQLIEWTAADAEPETGAELVQIQRLIVLWQKVWGTATSDRTKQILLSISAKAWSDKALEFSGLL